MTHEEFDALLRHVLRKVRLWNPPGGFSNVCCPAVARVVGMATRARPQRPGTQIAGRPATVAVGSMADSRLVHGRRQGSAAWGKRPAGVHGERRHPKRGAEATPCMRDNLMHAASSRKPHGCDRREALGAPGALWFDTQEEH